MLAFLQSPGLVAADTKHDLAACPGHFLAGALHAWTDMFPLGQLQNQAYGYLFPQGLFFLITDPLPDWVAQRLWWWLVLGVGWSGMLVLLRRLEPPGASPAPWPRWLAAAVFVLSPRTLTTLGAISSETWPVMLAPWVVAPLLTRRLGARHVAASVLAVAAMGAVNATATVAAALPAAVILVWLHRSARAAALWAAGCVGVSLWWLGPLVVLGRYSPPFTDFIESSTVTTRWLNLPEILRGTTSWTPFADSERYAGHLLVTEPVFVVLTSAVAALGVAGLALRRRLAAPFVATLLVGLVLLGAAHGPLGHHVIAFLDGPGVAARNLHKLDPLVRLPLSVGVYLLATRLPLPRSARELGRPGRRHAAACLVLLAVAGACSPAWTGRLSPRGAYERVPAYWQQTADWLNVNASGTRTMILPAAPFARQTWGWTRDEPLQPLLDVPWVVRDAVPLVPPEAIRGLDGVNSVLASDDVAPERALRSVARLGVGVLVIRHDLESGEARESADRLTSRAREAGAKITTFGEVDVVELDRDRSMLTTSAQPVTVAGGGESLALLDALDGPAARRLVDRDATVVTDTPALAARNYGAVRQGTSAPLASLAEGHDVRNAVPDYPSAGPLTRVETTGGRVRASSSAADATSFGGAQPEHSLTAAVDGTPETAWRPTPGAPSGQFIELEPDQPVRDPRVRVTATGDMKVLVSTGSATEEVELHEGEEQEVQLRGEADRVRVTVPPDTGPAGIAELGITDHPITRTVTVPDTSPGVQQFVFSQLPARTRLLARQFTAPRAMQVVLDAADCGPGAELRVDGRPARCGEHLELSPGPHALTTMATWATLTTPEFGKTMPATPAPTDGELRPADHDRLLVTGRAANPGLRASVQGTELHPTTVDAATQAFVVPAGVAGQVRLGFAGDRPYRASLLFGAVAWLLTVAACLWGLTLGGSLRRRIRTAPHLPLTQAAGVAIALGIVAGWPGALAGLIGWLIPRYTLLPRAVIAAGGVAVAGAWLAHAPWPHVPYAGDADFVPLAVALGLGALASRRR